MNARRTHKLVDHRVTRVITAISEGAGKDAELCSILRHDMLNLISVMRLRVDLLRRKEILPESESAVLVEAIRRMERLIDDWRTLSRVTEPRHDQGAFDLVTVVRQLVEGSRPGANLKKQQFTLIAEVDSAIMVGNLSEIQRAVDNLIMNAIKYTPESGSVQLIIQTMDEHVIIRVEDTGIGIPPSEIHRIFEAHFRASNAREQAIPGTGLGLAQVKSAVEHHDGRIYVESQIGRWTRIEIQLPLTVNMVIPGEPLQ